MTRDEFIGYVGQDDRVDRFVATCQKYGLRLRYGAVGDRCHIDAYTPDTGALIHMSPFQHTFMLDLQYDMATMLNGSEIDAGIAMLERICIGMNELEHPASEFIGAMRSL